MKKRTNQIISIVIILAIIGLSMFILLTKNGNTPENISKCIGKKSVLYVQLGCHACETQEAMFGENYKYLNVIDCLIEREKCMDIQKTPTWIINNKKYTGVRSIEELRKLTDC